MIVPKLNVELWQILSSFQRKSDVKLATIQRNIIAGVAISLSIMDDVLNDKINKKEMIQKSTDLVALLGHASSKLSVKRKLFIRSVLKDEYKDLVSVSGNVTEKLFGDNLSQSIKDINLRNKLKNKQTYQYKHKPYKRGYNRQNGQSNYNANYNKNQQMPFLGKGMRGMSSSTNFQNRKSKY